MLTPGQLLAGKYRLVRFIGEGSFSSVWEARNDLIGRPVALKVLHDSFAGSPKVLARFLREAKIASRPLHPVLPCRAAVEQV